MGKSVEKKIILHYGFLILFFPLWQGSNVEFKTPYKNY